MNPWLMMMMMMLLQEKYVNAQEIRKGEKKKLLSPPF